MTLEQIAALVGFVVLAIFVGWLVWRGFVWVVVWLDDSGVFEVIKGILAMIVLGGCLFLIGAVVLVLIVGVFQEVFGG